MPFSIGVCLHTPIDFCLYGWWEFMWKRPEQQSVNINKHFQKNPRTLCRPGYKKRLLLLGFRRRKQWSTATCSLATIYPMSATSCNTSEVFKTYQTHSALSDLRFHLVPLSKSCDPVVVPDEFPSPGRAPAGWMDAISITAMVEM